LLKYFLNIIRGKCKLVETECLPAKPNLGVEENKMALLINSFWAAKCCKLNSNKNVDNPVAVPSNACRIAQYRIKQYLGPSLIPLSMKS
jgi:hypothetical protein